MSPLTVHGIVAATAEIAPGEDDVELVEDGGLAALVTPAADPDARPRRRDLLRHSDVLQRAVDAATVLPLRFGTVFESREELVGELLRPRREELRAMLAELEGKVELSYKASLREEAVLAELVATEPEIAALRETTRNRSEAESYPERMRLGELVAAGLAGRRHEYEQRFLDCVAPHVVATLLPEEPPSPTVIEASLLVLRNRQKDVEDALEELAADTAHHLEARLLGPLPPYSFVTEGWPAESVA